MICRVTIKFITIWCLFDNTMNPQVSADVENDRNSYMPRVEDISVNMTNSTSVLLSWKIEHNFLEDLHSLSVWYRPRGRINDRVPRIEYDRDADRYTARFGVDESVYEWKNVVYTEFYKESEISKRNEMLIYTTGLYANLHYDFIVHRYTNSSDSVNRTAQIVAKTQWAAVKSGAGCFVVVDSGFATRKVKFHWRGYSEPGEYDIEVREEGPCFHKQPELKEHGQLKRAVREVSISRLRHWFVIKRRGHPEVEETVVNIPYQGDVLDEPANMRVGWNRSEGLYTVTWTKPPEINVANYTILWMGVAKSWNGRLYRNTMDVVHIPGDRTSFVMKTEEKALLFLAANTDTASTGLLSLEHYEDTERGSIRFNSTEELLGLPIP